MQIKLLALLAVIGGFIIGYIFSPVFGACFELVMDVMKGCFDEKIAELTNHVDVLQVLKESV